ncbi:hypothetical protein ACIXUO_04635 [Bacteroides fragilis]
MRKVCALLGVLIISVSLYASHIETAGLLIAGYSGYLTKAKILVNDDGTKTLVGIYDELIVIKEKRWKSVNIPLRNVDDDIANSNISTDVKRYLLNIQSKYSYYANGEYKGKSVTFCVAK